MEISIAITFSGSEAVVQALLAKHGEMMSEMSAVINQPIEEEKETQSEILDLQLIPSEKAEIPVIEFPAKTVNGPGF